MGSSRKSAVDRVATTRRSDTPWRGLRLLNSPRRGTHPSIPKINRESAIGKWKWATFTLPLLHYAFHEMASTATHKDSADHSDQPRGACRFARVD